jgi:hypothetical protein
MVANCRASSRRRVSLEQRIDERRFATEPRQESHVDVSRLTRRAPPLYCETADNGTLPAALCAEALDVSRRLEQRVFEVWS